MKLVDKKTNCRQPPGADVDAVAAIVSTNIRIPKRRQEIENPISLLQGLKAKQVVQLATGNDPDKCLKCDRGNLMPKTILDPV